MNKFEENSQKIQQGIFYISQAFELLLAIAVIIALLIVMFEIPHHFVTLWNTTGQFNEFLENIFEMIIGIELLKMLCRHDLDSVVEVLLFAVARGLIIEHMPIYFTLLGIIAIAILFMIRKFLFVSALDKDPTRKEKEKGAGEAGKE